MMIDFPRNDNGGWIVPANTEIPEDAAIPAHSVFGVGCSFGNGCRFGNWCSFGVGCSFGDECRVGNWCSFGDECRFGVGCSFGDECSLEGVTALRLLCLFNVDGSGRQVLVIRHAAGVLVRAGCFAGTADEFCTKAASEGKNIYVAVVRAVADALINTVPVSPRRRGSFQC